MFQKYCQACARSQERSRALREEYFKDYAFQLLPNSTRILIPLEDVLAFPRI